MDQMMDFLCGHFESIPFIYAIKFPAETDFFYFKECDTSLDSHPLLKSSEEVIKVLEKVSPIRVKLSREQLNQYWDGEKFVFNGEQLKTRLQLALIETKAKRAAAKSKTTDQLIFRAGRDNPIVFLKDFEQCGDVKSDKDKLFKIRPFVSDTDRPAFSALFLTGTWTEARLKFLKLYSPEFTKNKKQALNISFGEQHSLREFVEKKINALSTYTTLSQVNQIEIVLGDLPTHIANLFLLNEKFFSEKSEIFDFCDAIQEFAEQDEPETASLVEQQGLSRNLEIFDHQAEPRRVEPQPSTSSSTPTANTQTATTKRTRGRGGTAGGSSTLGRGISKRPISETEGTVQKKKRGRPRKVAISEPLIEEDESQSSTYSFLRQPDSDNTEDTL